MAQGRLRWSNPPRLEQAIGPGGDRPAIVTVLLFTGLRIAELVALDTGDLSISARKGQLPFAAARESATGREVVPGLVEVEVAVPRLSPASW